MGDFLYYLGFNPYLFAILLSWSMSISKKYTPLYFLGFIPILFGYQYILISVFIIQIITISFIYNKVLFLKRLFICYLSFIFVPIIGELSGGIIQLISFAISHNTLDHLTLNIVCFIPEILICGFIYYWKKRYIYQLKELAEELNDNLNFFHLLLWIIWTFTIATYTIWSILELTPIKPLATLALMTVALIIAIILIFSIYHTIHQNQIILKMNVQNAEIKQIQEYSSRLENANMKLRKARHDYKNSLLSLNGYLIENDLRGASDYLNKLVKENNRLQIANQTMTLELANLKVKEVKYLLIDKLQQAQDLGISVKVEVNKEISSFPCNIVSLIRCIGIFLDNAIEECRNHDKAEINVLLTKYTNNNYSFIIQNSIFHSINIMQILKPKVTSKKAHQGLGLANVNEIVNSAPNFSLEIEQNERIISFELTIQNKRGH